MRLFQVEGGRALSGSVAISGAKNAALKLLAAAVLTGERCRFTNVPEIEDVRVMAQTLRELGVVVDHPEPNVYEVAAGDVEWLFVPLEAAAKMRASFMLLGPLLARFGRVIISNPGGDRIGRRPVNLHVDAMRALGAEIEYRNGYYFATAPGRLRGTEVRFPSVSVMGTENVDAGRHPGRRPHGHPPGRAGTGDRRSHRVPPEDGRQRAADLPGHDRGGRQAAPARGRASGLVGPDRGRDVRRGGRGHRRQDHVDQCPVRSPRRVPRDDPARPESGSRARRTRIEVDGTALGGAGFRAVDITTGAYPGLATDIQPPTSVLLTQATGGVEGPRDDLRGPARMDG
ncbi:MAG: hypothetical protein WKF78_08240 [Candidatus Limnocylindrales bacterium]